MWESHAALLRDFPKPLREASAFLAFRGGVISTADLLFGSDALLFAAGLGVAGAGAASGLPVAS